MTTLESRTSTSVRDARRVVLPDPPQLQERARDGITSVGEVVRSAARSLPSTMLQPVSANGGIAYQPRVLAALLSYYYAADTFSSEDIEHAIRRDGAFVKVCGGEFPDARVLRRFRRANREAIEHCLYAALRFVAERSGKHHTEAEVIEDVHQRITNAILMDMP